MLYCVLTSDTTLSLISYISFSVECPHWRIKMYTNQWGLEGTEVRQHKLFALVLHHIVPYLVWVHEIVKWRILNGFISEFYNHKTCVISLIFLCSLNTKKHFICLQFFLLLHEFFNCKNSLIAIKIHCHGQQLINTVIK